MVGGVLFRGKTEKILQRFSASHAGVRQPFNFVKAGTVVNIASQRIRRDSFKVPLFRAACLDNNFNILRQLYRAKFSDVFRGAFQAALQIRTANVPVDGPGLRFRRLRDAAHKQTRCQKNSK